MVEVSRRRSSRQAGGRLAPSIVAGASSAGPPATLKALLPLDEDRQVLERCRRLDMGPTQLSVAARRQRTPMTRTRPASDITSGTTDPLSRFLERIGEVLAALDSQLAVSVAEMEADRLRRDEQGIGDLAVREAVGRE